MKERPSISQRTSHKKIFAPYALYRKDRYALFKGETRRTLHSPSKVGCANRSSFFFIGKAEQNFVSFTLCSFTLCCECSHSTQAFPSGRRGTAIAVDKVYQRESDFVSVCIVIILASQEERAACGESNICGSSESEQAMHKAKPCGIHYDVCCLSSHNVTFVK